MCTSALHRLCGWCHQLWPHIPALPPRAMSPLLASVRQLMFEDPLQHEYYMAPPAQALPLLHDTRSRQAAVPCAAVDVPRLWHKHTLAGWQPATGPVAGPQSCAGGSRRMDAHLQVPRPLQGSTQPLLACSSDLSLQAVLIEPQTCTLPATCHPHLAPPPRLGPHLARPSHRHSPIVSPGSVVTYRGC